MDSDTIIRKEPQSACQVCGGQGSVLYESLRDRLFGAPGQWNLRKCIDLHCGHIWIDPRPIAEDIAIAYRSYYTHADSAVPPATPLRRAYRRMKRNYVARKYGYSAVDPSLIIRLSSYLLYLLPARRESLDAEIFYLHARPGGRLLEVGCGSGNSLRNLQGLGWDVEGIDFDPNSVKNARLKELKVREGDLQSQQYDSNLFDAVVMSHVIEHVSEPLQLLQECYRVLKPGGQLVVLTPNSDSLGHRMYRSNWRGLEPPRHYHIFNSNSLVALARRAGFSAVSCSTTARARKIFIQSRLASKSTDDLVDPRHSLLTRVWGEMMESIESILILILRRSGEELKLRGGKDAAS